MRPPHSNHEAVSFHALLYLNCVNDANFPIEHRYKTIPHIIHILIKAGAHTGSMKFTTGARYHDRIFMEMIPAPWFERERQPFYEDWKILYDYDDEQDE